MVAEGHLIDPRRVERIFHDASAIEPSDARLRFLERACGDDETLRRRVERLLAAHHDGGRFLRTGETILPEATSGDGAGSTAAAADDDDPDSTLSERAGAVVGRYKLLEEIGAGGFGVVFLAEQTEPVVRRVAVKILKAGMDTRDVLARFGAERQALAMMDHPHIARVLDGGATRSGRPYFVMELVRGEPITEWADRQRLSIVDRLTLFRQVCGAVQHAHQKGVIHRDIKPSNVLVMLSDDAPAAKVIDFGIAKPTVSRLTERTLFTRAGQLVGTPQYMSPEQAGMAPDVDTRSDIYSLGVLLYELLTGSTPLDAGRLRDADLPELQRLIRDAATPRPSTRVATIDAPGPVAECRQVEPARLGLLLRGDLDWIVLKALEKDRVRRYATAGALSEDIRRHLENEPVEASPPGAAYRVRKFVRRHRGPVAAAAAIAAMLVVGTAGTATGLVLALRAQARQAAATAALERVVEFQAAQIERIDRADLGPNLRDGLLDEARASLHRADLAPAEAARRVEALEPLVAGVNFTELAARTLESSLFEETLDGIERRFGDLPVTQAGLYQTMATSLRRLGRYERASDVQRRALALRRRHLGNGHPDTLRSLAELGALLTELNRLDEAETHLAEALETGSEAPGGGHVHVLDAQSAMGALRFRQGDLETARRHLETAVSGYRRVLGDDSPKLYMSMRKLAVVLRALGDPAATAGHEASVAGLRRLLGDEHPDTLAALNSLGTHAFAQRRWARAEGHFRAVMEALERVRGRSHPDTLMAVDNLGSVLVVREKLDEAEPLLRRALESHRRVLGDDHSSTIRSMVNYCELMLRLDRLEEAERLSGEVIARGAGALPADHAHQALFISLRGRVLGAMGRYAEAVEHLLDAHERLASAGGDYTVGLAEVSRALAALYGEWHEVEPGGGHDDQAGRWERRFQSLVAGSGAPDEG